MEASAGIVIVACADADRRQRLSRSLQGMRWEVREAAGGAAAMAYLEECQAEAMLLDSWLPDLESGALADIVQQLYPSVDLVRLDDLAPVHLLKGARRHE